MESVAFAKKKKSLQVVRSQLSGINSKNLEERTAKYIKQKNYEIDSQEIANTEEQRSHYAEQAMK